MGHGISHLEHTGGIEPEERFLYGIMAEFDSADAILKAADRVHRAGYKKIDAYSPFPVEDLDEKLGFRDTWVIWIMFLAAVLGAAGGFALLYYCTAVAYPLNIAGRPAYGWPSYIPITFECMVLFAALAGVVGMIVVNGLPQPYHPVFDAPEFDRATSDRFFLCIQANDEKAMKEGRRATRRFMESLGGVAVAEVERRK